MQQVLDDYSKPINGLFRSEVGLVVDDPDEFNKYKILKETVDFKDQQIKDLQAKVEKLFAILENNDKLNL